MNCQEFGILEGFLCGNEEKSEVSGGNGAGEGLGRGGFRFGNRENRVGKKRKTDMKNIFQNSPQKSTLPKTLGVRYDKHFKGQKKIKTKEDFQEMVEVYLHNTEDAFESTRAPLYFGDGLDDFSVAWESV